MRGYRQMINMKALLLCSLVLATILSVAECQIGGKVPMPIGTPKLAALVRFAAKEIGTEYRVVSVHRATQQLVSGMIYRITFTALKLGYPTKRRLCNVAIYEVPWLNYKELEGYLCKFPNKRHLLNPDQLV